MLRRLLTALPQIKPNNRSGRSRSAMPAPVCLLLVLLLLSASTAVNSAGLHSRHPAARTNNNRFYLRNGDRVVFYGDSITQQRWYCEYIESYCVTRFPRQTMRFYASGISGDGVWGGAAGDIDVRLRRDVFAYRPDVVTVLLGTNDGGYVRFNQKIYQNYVTGMRYLVRSMEKKRPGMRLTLISPTTYDEINHKVAIRNGYNSVMLTFGEALQGIARENKQSFVDVNHPMMQVLKASKAVNPTYSRQLIPDRVHPSPAGHLVLASEILKRWNAPSVVAVTHIDAHNRRITQALNCRVGLLPSRHGILRFRQLDRSLPWGIGRAIRSKTPETAMNIRRLLPYTDLERRLNRYELQLSGLTAGSYTLRVDGIELGHFTRQALQHGVDLAALELHPACRQSEQVFELVRRHSELHFRRWRGLQVPEGSAREIIPENVRRKMALIDAREEQLLKQLHRICRPRPHLVELVPYAH